MSEGKQTHTALPWTLRLGDDGSVRITDARGSFNYIKLASPWLEGSWEDDAEAKANAAYIVTACNAFPALVEALRRQDGHLSILMGNIHGSAKVDQRWEGMEEVVRGWRAEIDAALSAASTDQTGGSNV